MEVTARERSKAIATRILIESSCQPQLSVQKTLEVGGSNHSPNKGTDYQQKYS